MSLTGLPLIAYSQPVKSEQFTKFPHLIQILTRIYSKEFIQQHQGGKKKKGKQRNKRVSKQKLLKKAVTKVKMPLF